MELELLLGQSDVFLHFAFAIFAKLGSHPCFSGRWNRTRLVFQTGCASQFLRNFSGRSEHITTPDTALVRARIRTTNKHLVFEMCHMVLLLERLKERNIPDIARIIHPGRQIANVQARRVSEKGFWIKTPYLS